MAFIAVSGEPGCRQEEVARIAAQRLHCELVTEAGIAQMIAAEFGEANPIPDKAWRPLATSILASLGAEAHLIVCGTGAEGLMTDLPEVFRFHVTAPESVRMANVVSDGHLSRPEAKAWLRRMQSGEAQQRKRRLGRKASPTTSFDLILNTKGMATAEIVDLLEAAVRLRRLLDAGPLPLPAAAKIQFQMRLQLARFGIVPPDRMRVERKPFGHPSEEVFANLLDFYRIAWDYEPRSFPLQWDKDGQVSEAFTPDFYLPEFDLYVELTTMKQANVTKKNRKIRLLRTIYPHVNIQVFYQKDVQDLVMKYGLPERLAQ
jgi:cytidylate kinase